MWKKSAVEMVYLGQINILQSKPDLVDRNKYFFKKSNNMIYSQKTQLFFSV